MPDKLEKEQYTKTEVEELLRKQSDTLNERVEVAEMVAEMTDPEKAYYKSLDGEAQQEFLFMESAQRATVLKSVQDDNPVVYTATNGDEFRKKDDPRLVKMAREKDEDNARFKEMMLKREQEQFEKRAETELPNFPGTVKTRAAVLRAVETIKDEGTREEALKALKAQNARMSKALEEFGKRGTGQSMEEGESAFEILDQRAKDLQKQNPKLTYADAFDQVSNADMELAKRAVEEG